MVCELYRGGSITAEEGSSFTGSEIAKRCILDLVRDILKTSATVRSCANCVKDSGENLFEQLAFQKNNLIIFHSQMDKRNDGTDTVQLMIFIRGVDAAVHMCKYFATLCAMEDGAIAADLFTQIKARHATCF